MELETTQAVAAVAANAEGMTVLAKAIIIGLGVMGPALGLGMVFSKGLEGISRNPQAAGKIIPWLLMGAGMIELFGLAAIGLFFLL